MPAGTTSAQRVIPRVVTVLLLIIAGLAVIPSLAVPAQASTRYVGARILDQAETRLNDPYSYGSAGPYYFDCSGLVDWSAVSVGERNWPRDTYGIAAQIGYRFVLTSHPVRGDLALWGTVRAPYHVEIVTAWSGWTFGAETSTWAGRVTWHSSAWFPPSFYLHILW